MYVYAGIDEAGYGPMFGPLVVGRSVMRIPKLACDSAPPRLWQRLSKAVGKDLSDARGRIIINDSKKLKTKAAGVKHLERGCLAFAGLGEQGTVRQCRDSGFRTGVCERGLDSQSPARTDQRDLGDVRTWLDALGTQAHHDLGHLPWYAASAQRPWQALPQANTPGELAIARAMLGRTCERIGVECDQLAAGVVFEDRFNRIVAQTGSKAAVTWRVVVMHLRELWQTQGQHHPTVFVDRLGGRTDYAQPLAQAFDEAEVSVLRRGSLRSGYLLRGADRAMTLWFEVEADSAHMPVALASMSAKYTRELLMSRFQAYFTQRLPEVKPTAGYGQDARRFWDQLRPHLRRLGIDANHLKRLA